MALIKCPECGSSISDKAEKCPHCGLPASYFPNFEVLLPDEPTGEIDEKNLGNLLLSFDRDYTTLFVADHYVSHCDEEMLRKHDRSTPKRIYPGIVKYIQCQYNAKQRKGCSILDGDGYVACVFGAPIRIGI